MRRPVRTAVMAEVDGRLMSISAPTQPPPTVLQQLHLEWRRLSGCRRSIERVAGWHLAVGPVATLDDLLGHAGFGAVQRGGHADDRVLATLVSLARHDDLAGRVVLQRILPGVASLVRRRTANPITRADLTDEVVAAAWTVIRTYPVERRPDYVAANLLRRVEYEVFRKPTRRRATFAPRPTHLFDELSAPEPRMAAADEIDELLDLAHQHGFPAAEIDLARRLARGESTLAIASDLGVSDRTIRNRRTNLTTRLAELAAEAAAA
ncbi:MAG: hypothetical protein WEB78_06845 [Ilumatobacteraceae bacterium]